MSNLVRFSVTVQIRSGLRRGRKEEIVKCFQSGLCSEKGNGVDREGKKCSRGTYVLMGMLKVGNQGDEKVVMCIAQRQV